MAIQYINTGSSANSGDGDSLRTAFTKINRNFGEIATLIGTTATEFTEIVQDSVEGMFVHSSHTGVTAVYDDDNDKIIFTVTATGSGNGSVYQGDVPPTANTSTLWYDTINGKSFVYYDGYWVEASPTTAGPTGPSGPSGAASSVAGPTGPSGPSGASLAGPQGPTGPSGANGTIGVDGATGPTGPMAFQQGSPFTWTSLTAYNENDIVTYVGSLFILSDYPSYIQSYTPDTYAGWRLFLPAGSTGPTGPEGPQGPSWTTDQNAELNTTGSPTFATLTVTSTATFLGDIVGGQYQGYDDISLIKDDPSEANITIRNLHNDGSGVLRIVDNVSGGLHISHQNSTLSSGTLNAGENYIHGESPNDVLNIGLYSDLNFYADSNKYFNPSDPTTASIQISAADRSVTFNATATFVYDLFVGVVQGYDDISLIKDDPSEVNITLRNLHNDGSSVIRLVDNLSGGLHISHQNSTMSSGTLNAGENYIHGESPNDKLNIGLYSDLNFYADSNKYFNPGDPTTASIQISAADRSIKFNETAFTTHLIPQANDQYDLGSTSSQWRSLYVSSSTIYIAGRPLGINQDGSLTFEGESLGSDIFVGDTAPAATTGSIWWNSVEGKPYINYDSYWVDLVSTTVGPAGPSGPEGAASSIPGPTGPSGPSGVQGDAGPQGPQGDAGPQGPLGPSGPSGPSGVNGSNGQEGPQGPQGVAGPQGPTGPDSYTPGDGTKWIGSPTVSTFTQGLDELADRISTVETAGGAGPTGPEGPQGPSGVDGATGPEGPQGPSGVDGATGPEGPQGPTGPGVTVNATAPGSPSQGDLWYDTDDGNTYIYVNSSWVDSNPSTPGPQGPQGVTGPQGPQGPGSPISTVFTITNTTAATSTNSGALQVAGGAGVGGSVYVGGNVTANKFIGDGSSLTNVTVNVAGNIIGTGTNVSLVAGSFTMTFDNTGLLTLPTMGGDEGGEINLGVPATNTTLLNSVKFDVYRDRIRFFDGSTKGVYIDLSQATTGVGTLLNNRVAALVNAGSFVTMDNIKATVTTSGNRGLSLASVSGSFAINVGGTYGAGVGSGGGSTTLTVTTTASGSLFGWNFTAQSDISTYIITDTTNSIAYRITLQIGGSYNNNMISIERLI